MELYQLIDYVCDKTEEYVQTMDLISAKDCGLDMRIGRIWINNEGIACRKNTDNLLQYYGGFEYVDKEYRIELGEYIFYLTDDERVNGCIEHYMENKNA